MTNDTTNDTEKFIKTSKNFYDDKRVALSNRLVLFRSTLGMTKQDLCNALDLSYSVINNVEHQRTSFTFSNLVDGNNNFNEYVKLNNKGIVENAFLLSMTGVISPHDIFVKSSANNTEDTALTDLFQQLSMTDQNFIIDKIKYLIKSYEEEIPTKKVALLGQTACGNPIDAISNADEFVETNDLRASFALKAVGNSMLPLISDGDIMLIRQTEELEVGDIGIFQINKTGFSVDEQVTCKVLKSNKNGVITLVPLNNSFDPIVVGGKNEQIKIIGKYLGKL